MNAPQYGDRHKTNANYFWNGHEWMEDVPSTFWDFELKNDWPILVASLFLVGLGIVGLVVIN